MGKLYKRNYGNSPPEGTVEHFRFTENRARQAEEYLREKKCSQTKIKAKVFLKFTQIKRIEDSNISSESKVRRIKALYPNDNCWKKFVESEY